MSAPLLNDTYDATNGQLGSITFPTSYPSTFRLRANFAYQWNIPYFVRDGANTSNVWWQLHGTSWAGQLTGETTRDTSSDPTIDVTHNYDAVTGWLSSITAGLSFGSGTLQNEAYQYDKVGNVIQRQNNNLGLTENYYYDNLYRLDHSTVGSTTVQMAYDAMGNITSRGDVAGGATWTYDPARKHAVTQAGSSAFSYAYDQNGNVSSRNGRIVGRTSYNYINGVSTSTESATFDYGPDRQRWRMIYQGPSGTETTYYATPTFEAVATSSGTEYRHYIYQWGKPIMVISRTTAGIVNIRSLLADDQGSISTVVTDSTGTAYTTESFTPFGNRREASNWSGPPTTTERSTMDGVTRQGYTFQTVLGSMGLNHMNGRVEDAVTGRFLSPDPETADPFNTQDYNRYSYVDNNPSTFVDPSGFDECKEHGCVKPNDPDPREGFAAFGSENSCYGNCGLSYSYGIGHDAVNGNQTDTSLQVFRGPNQNTATFLGSWHSNGMWGSAENPNYPEFDPNAGFGPLTAGFGGGGFAASGSGGGSGAGLASMIDEIVVQARRNGSLAGVKLNFNLPWPIEQLWIVTNDGDITNIPTKSETYVDSCGNSLGQNVPDGSVFMPDKSDIFALIHTHPYWGYAWPGSGDYTSAQSYSVYNINPSGAWVLRRGASRGSAPFVLGGQAPTPPPAGRGTKCH